MATMFEQKGTPYRRSFGGTMLIAAILALFLVGILIFGNVIRTQLVWKDFQLQFAASIYDAGSEEGWLKADDTHQAVRVCGDNAVLVLRMMQTGKAAKLGEAVSPQRKIWLNFSNGTHGILSEVGDGQTHVDFTGLDGKRYQIQLGKCKFENMVTLLSVKGAAYENELWTD